MAVALLIAFVVVPLVEIYVIIQVGQVLGVLPTILLLLAVSIAGAALVRREGVRAWRRFTLAVSEHRVPGREVLDGALLLTGGALLLAPGFVTDALGFLLVLPPTRPLFRRLLLRRSRPPGARRTRRTRRTRTTVIEGEAVGEGRTGPDHHEPSGSAGERTDGSW